MHYGAEATSDGGEEASGLDQELYPHPAGLRGALGNTQLGAEWTLQCVELTEAKRSATIGAG